MSKISDIIDKVISRENKDKFKAQIVRPILDEINNELKPYFFFLVGMYMSIIIPLILIIIILLLRKFS
jgi:ABC-type transport system involved in cytochrome bd biosynthesis fused ATPase/permease subunit